MPGSATSALSAGTVQGMRTAWLLMVMPRSRSMSIRSRYCARAARASTTPVSCSIRSASVDLPWSMWAMMQKFRMIDGSVWPGCGAVLDTGDFRYGVQSVVDPFFHGGTVPTESQRGTPRAVPGPDERGCAPVTTYPAPPLATARRLEWAFLPPGIRRYVERRCGSPVVAAHSQGAGFTPGFASVLVCEDGSRHFVKAASTKAQRPFADAYREEARRLASLPEGVPAPRLSWLLDDDWVVLGIEHVEATNPARPWSRARPGRHPGHARAGRCGARLERRLDGADPDRGRAG